MVSNKSDAFGLERAKSAVIPTGVFLRQNFTNNQEMDRKIGDYLESFEVDLIVLAGYMKILTPEFTQRFQGKILNIHPSLLPKYAGLNTYQRALEAGDTEHGTTVHFVNEEVDGGAIILQAKVPISQMIMWKTLNYAQESKNIVFTLWRLNGLLKIV
ncbi:phosphoribosylglycinamide formyltransferase [Rodentibacter pneumotropicus]|uniref:Phosphoribosylglycinamide formyltransferase n=1 Tax=Rodentibacter pneumotropicus TaxID=758 RepID=A0A3S4VD37_9PAST|nr:phosphoribosylglycinamide formyltransferase [Rodentibacter pneumotropicus]